MTKATKTVTKPVAISDITFETDLQFRVSTDARHIKDLKSVWEADGKFAELPELMQCGDVYWIKDGTHRILAAKEAGAEKIRAEVTKVADKEEAMFLAMSVNTQHGQVAEVNDLKLAIRAIKDSESAHLYKKNPFTWDKKKLREVLKCTPRKLDEAVVDTASEMDLDRDWQIEKLHEEGKSARAIAKELEIPKSTVIRIVANMTTEVTQYPDDVKTGHPEETAQTSTEQVDENAQTRKTVHPEETSPVYPKGSTSLFDDVVTHEAQQDTEEEFDDLDVPPWEDEDDGCNIDGIIESLSRKEETKVIKPKAVACPEEDQIVAMYEALPAERQAKVFARLQAYTK